MEVKGDGTYNPQSMTGTWFNRDFLQYLPSQGWCWSWDIVNFTINQAHNIINSNTNSQTSETCHETPGSLTITKQQ